MKKTTMRTYDHSRPCDELMHYGILGIKWGIRRYPNEFKNGVYGSGRIAYRKTVVDKVGI